MTSRRTACSCGQLHLTIEGQPSRIAMCHCLACQRRTGAVISNQARFQREQVSIAGEATTWTRTADSGHSLTFHFCPTCGSTVRSLNMLRGIRGNCQSVLSPGTGRGPSGAFERHVAGHQSTDQPGNNTVSITWMTPFDCMTLRMVT